MTLAKDISAKFAVAFVAVAMIFTMFAPAANAQETTEDLEALIETLMAQIAALESGATVTEDTSMSSSAVCPYTWTRDLSQGSEGADVMKLQQFLNETPDLRVAVTGAGSPGNETMYYGPATAAAVSKMQVMFRAEVLTPGGLVNPTGYFGPSSRAKANSLCVAAPAMDSGESMEEGEAMEEGEEMMEEDEGNNSGPVSLSGEASLDEMEIDDANEDEIEEGEADAPIAEVTLEFTDGDAEISRIDIQLLGDGETDTSDVEPWEAFETISLWVDGDMVAEMNADDEDDYLDEDEGTLRFSGLDIVAMEDEDLEIIIAATVMDNLDNDELVDWDVSVEAMRFFDADGVSDTLTSGFDFGVDATFTVEEAGAEDELDVNTSSADPEAATLVLEDDDSTTHVVFAFDLDTDESTNDIEINEITIDAVTTSGDLTDYVDGDDVRLLVDGDAVNEDDVTVTATTIVFEFDNGDFMIDAEDEVTVEVEVEFDALDAGEEGNTVEFSVDSANIDAEGADDLSGSQLSGSASSDTHTLITEGIVILAEDITTSTDTSGDNDSIGEFEVTFEVTAYEEDFYITDNVAAGAGTDGVNFTVDTDVVAAPASVTGTLTSSADEDNAGVFTVDEGETETFTLRVVIDADDAAGTGDYRVSLDNVIFSESNDGVTTPQTRVLTPVQDYRTDYETIQADNS